jgi:hypothetical protein
VEVRECFSSPEILELKAQCELARYRGAATNRLTQQIQLKQVWTCSQGHYQRAEIHQRGATLPIRT